MSQIKIFFKKHIRNYYQANKYRKKNGKISKKIINYAATGLIAIIKFLLLAQNISGALFKMLLGRPLFWLGRALFYKVILPLYSLYLRLLKKLGIKSFQESLLGWLLNQKMVHVLVVSLTVLLISINLAPKTQAGGITDKAHRTILAQIVQSEFSGFAEDEQFVIESFDREASISDVQQSYLDNLAAFKPQPRASVNAVEEEESLLPTAQNGASLVKPDIATTRITKQPRTETVQYEVQSGDSVSTIAEEFEISVSTILWANDLSAYSIIRPGQKLDILPVSGLQHNVKKGETLSSIAIKYDIDEEDILEANRLGAGDVLGIGQELVLPGARKITYTQTQPKTYTGFSALKDIVTSPTSKTAGNKMAWPTDGARITQYYSWRHHGLDIGNKTGTPIYSSDAGTIELAGWGTGYGNQIVVDHGGGKKTRYAHLSKFYVKVGDKVSKGQVIAAMGSTGWSTGPHLHFEVIINNTKYNPLNYIK